MMRAASDGMFWELVLTEGVLMEPEFQCRSAL